MADRAWPNVYKIFFLILGLSGVLVLSDDVQKAFLIQEAQKDSSSSKLFITHSPYYVTFLKNAGSIPSHEVTSIFALALGFTVSKDISWSGLLAGDVFKRPKANILFSIDGVTKDDKFNVPAQVAFPVEESENAPSIASMLASSNADGDTLSTRLSKVFKGKPLTVSISADESLAAIGSGFGENSHTFLWKEDQSKFLLTDDDNAGVFEDMQSSKQQLLKKFAASSFAEGVKFSQDGNHATVAVPGSDKAVFNMEIKEDFLMFAEVQMILDTLQKLSTNPGLVNDGIPDIFTLSISSLKAIRKRYGKESPQAKGAVQFLKSVIPKLASKFADLYKGNALVEVLTTEWQGDLNERFPQDVSSIYQLVQGQLESRDLTTFHQELPHVTLRNDMDVDAKDAICSSLQNKLLAMQSKLKVNCFGGSSLHRKRRAVGADPTVKPTTKPSKNPHNLAYNYTPMYSAIFNIWLWLLVVLVLSLYVIALVLWYMDPGRDSIIYRMTSQRMKTD